MGARKFRGRIRSLVTIGIMLWLLPVLSVAAANASLAIPPKMPTPVKVAIDVVNVRNIDSGQYSFTIKYVLNQSWVDHRVVADAGVYVDNDAVRQLGQIWQPRLFFVNEERQAEIQHQELTIQQNGTVNLRKTGVVTLLAQYQFKYFPFDTQKLPIVLQPYSNTAKDVVLQTTAKEVVIDKSVVLHSWKLLGVSHQLKQSSERLSHSMFSRLEVVLTIKRGLFFYLTKMYTPLLCFILVTCAIFYYPGIELNFQVPVLLTSLVLITLFSLRIYSDMPAVAYLTRLDVLIGLSRIWILAATIACVFLYVHYREGHSDSVEKDAKIRTWFKVIFPLSYCVIWIVLVVRGFLF